MRISVIVPCYNVVAFLSETLGSVLAQTYADWECICVDDGSTDGTAEILDSFVKRDGRFRMVRKVNEGVCAARNDAIGMATGDYICFVDGDDVISPRWLENFADNTLCGRADLVRQHLTFWRQDEGMLKPPLACEDDRAPLVFDGHDAVMAWGWKTYTTDGYVVLTAYRRQLFLTSGIRFLQGMKINEDIILNLSLLPYVACAVQTSYDGYFYRMRPTSAWHAVRSVDGSTRYIDESVALWRAARTRLVKLSCAQEVRQKVTSGIWRGVVEWLERGRAEDRCRQGEIVRSLSRAFQADLLYIPAVKWYWWLALFVIFFAQTLSVARLTYRVWRGYHGFVCLVRRK